MSTFFCFGIVSVILKQDKAVLYVKGLMSEITIGVNLVPYMLVGGVFNADNKLRADRFPFHNVSAKYYTRIWR